MRGEGPSRSALKREEEERQRLASEMISLPQARVDELPIPAEIREAIRVAQQPARNAPRRRARLHVATLLRGFDPGRLREILASIQSGAAPRSSERDRGADRWIDLLVADEAAAVTALRDRSERGRSGSRASADVPAPLDIPRLRQLVRNLRRAESSSSTAGAPRQGGGGAAVTPTQGDGAEPPPGGAGRARAALRLYLTEVLPDEDLGPDAS